KGSSESSAGLPITRVSFTPAPSLAGMPPTSLATGRIVAAKSCIGEPSCAENIGRRGGICDRAGAWLSSGPAGVYSRENAASPVVVERRPGGDFRQCPPATTAQAGARIDGANPHAGRRGRLAHDDLAGSIRFASVVLNR